MKNPLLFIAAIASLGSLPAAPLESDADTLLLLHCDGNLDGSAGESPVTATGISFTTGIHDQALVLAPGNEVTFLSAGNIDPTQGTIEFWMKPDWGSPDGQDRYVLSFGGGGGMLFGKDGADNWRAIFNRFGEAGQAEIDVGIPANDWTAGEWRHIAVTWDASFLRLFFNGVQVAETAVTITLPAITATTFELGDGPSDLGAAIDELRISSRPRTAQEIMASYLARPAPAVRLILDCNGDLNGADGEIPSVATDITFEPGLLDQAARFGATSQAVFPSTDNIDSQQGTVELWLKPDWDDNEDNVQHNFLTWGGEGGLMLFRDPGNHLRALLNRYGSGGNPEVHAFIWWGDEELPAREWRHIAMSWDATLLRLYVNGEMVDEEPVTFPLPVIDDPNLRIGGEGGECALAAFDQIRISDMVRSAAEILASYREGVPLPDTLLRLDCNGNLDGVDGETPDAVSGVSYEPGKFGTGAYFAPGNEVIYPSEGNLEAQQGTIEFWLKPRWSGNDGAAHSALCFGGAGGMLIGKDAADYWRCTFNRFGGSGEPELAVSTSVSTWPADQWRHIAVTWDASFIRLFIDGEMRDEVPVTISLPAVADATFLLGGDGSSDLDAVVDALRIDSLVRTPAEILANYRSGTVDGATLLQLPCEGDLNGLDGEIPDTAANVNFEDGVLGQAARLGPDSEVIFPAAGNIDSQQGTIEFWMKPDWAGSDGNGRWFLEFGGGGGILFGKDGGNYWRCIFNRFGAGGNPELGVGTSANQWPASQWRHVAVSWDASLIRLYVNGEILDSKPVTFPLPAITDTTFRIGGAGTERANSLIDQFRISSVAREPQEIVESYLSGVSITSVAIVPGRNSLSGNPAVIEIMDTWTDLPGLIAQSGIGTLSLPANAATWTSDDEAVATIDTEGRIVAQGPGTTTLHALCQGIATTVQIRVISAVLPPVEELIDPELATPAAGSLWEVPIAIIRYLPTNDGENVDSDRTGFSGTLAALKDHIDLCGRRAKFMLEEGSRYHGYQDPAAQPSLGYRVVKIITVYEPFAKGKEVAWNPGWYRPDYIQILERFDGRTLVENLGVKEFWLWGWHHAGIEPAESNMSSPLTGDISNSERYNDDLPVYRNSYVLYNYNFTRSQNEAVHNHGHQLESILSHVNQLRDGNTGLFWDKWCGRNPDGSFQQGRCGNNHFPPNGTSDYDYGNPTPVASDCMDWTPDGTGTWTEVNADTWLNIPYPWPAGTTITNTYERTEAHYYIFWMQNMPGRGAHISYDTDALTNWWAFTAEWDYALQSGLGLHCPTEAIEERIAVRTCGFDSGLFSIRIPHREGVLFRPLTCNDITQPEWKTVVGGTLERDGDELRISVPLDQSGRAFFLVEGFAVAATEP